MRTVVVAFLGMLGFSTTAQAQSVDFIGSVCLTSVTAGCVSEGWNVGNCAIARFRPAV